MEKYSKFLKNTSYLHFHNTVKNSSDSKEFILDNTAARSFIDWSSTSIERLLYMWFEIIPNTHSFENIKNEFNSYFKTLDDEWANRTKDLPPPCQDILEFEKNFYAALLEKKKPFKNIMNEINTKTLDYIEFLKDGIYWIKMIEQDLASVK